MPLELVVHNIGFVFSIVLTLSLGLLVYIKRAKDADATLNVTYFWLIISYVIWMISYVMGVNLHDPHLSQLFCIVAILTALIVVILNTQLILAMAGRLKSQKKILTALYVISGLFIIFYAFFPDTLLLPSKPQLYMPNFFVAGKYFAIQDTFFLFCFLYLLVQAYISYKRADHALRNRLKYFFVGNAFAYSVSLLPELLLYGIHVDPIAASLAGLYNIPLAYAILKYNVINLNILARRAFGYALSVAGVTIFILLIGYANDTVVAIIPNFPRWLLPLLSAVLAVVLAVLVWKKIKEVDVLKYQFVNVVTHKFRTPLTHIKWSVENIRNAADAKERDVALNDITEAHGRLFQLTDMLAGLSASENSEYMYKYEPYSVHKLVNDTISAVQGRAKEKKITFENAVSESLPPVYIDHQKIQFALQTVMENGLSYSYADGKIHIEAEVKKDFVILSVRDYGIGISPEDMPRLFSKFYRGINAQRAHTEGMGIGLYLSRDILQRHGGDLSAVSEGLSKGSTFHFKIPVAKEGAAPSSSGISPSI